MSFDVWIFRKDNYNYVFFNSENKWQRPWKTRIKSELFGVIQTNSPPLWWTTLLYYNEVYMGKCLRCFGRSSGSKYVLYSQTNKQIFTNMWNFKWIMRRYITPRFSNCQFLYIYKNKIKENWNENRKSCIFITYSWYN